MNIKKISCLVLALLLSLTCLSGAAVAAEDDYGVVTIQNGDRVVTFTSMPTGVLCANLYSAENLVMLGLGDRIVGKNVHTLLRYFAEWKHRKQDDLQLVLIGGGDIAIPESVKDDVYDLGFVSKQDKYNAMAAASLLCQPSHNESFSLVIMESWLCGRPVLVSSQCAVTKDFAKRSNGGLYFKDYFEFEGCVEYILEHPEAAAELGANGGAFVRENFEWDIIVEKYRTFFQKLMGA